MLLRRSFDGVRLHIDTATSKACVGTPGRLPPHRRKFRPIEDLLPLELRRYAMTELALYREEAGRFAGDPEDASS